VRDVLCDGDKRTRMIDVCRKSDIWNGTLARWANQEAMLQGKTLQSVQAHVGTQLKFLDSPAVYRNTLASSFDPAHLLTGKMTIYLVIPPDQLAAKSNLLRLWLGTLLRECVKNGLQERKIVRFVIDEAAVLGHMVEIEQALNQYRSYGVRLMLIYQALSQLKTCWPAGGDQTVLAGCSKVFMGVADYQTADYISSLLGDFTNVSTSGGSSRGGSSQHSSGGQQSASRSESWNENHNWSTHARRLMTAEEILNMDRREALVVTPGVRPFTVRTCRSFEGDWKPDRGMGMFKIIADTIALLVMAAFAAFLAASLYR
jgi:type IV secretion system protein VirD4